MSNVEIDRFHGFGNETVSEGDSEFYKTQQTQYLLNPSFRLGLADPVDLSIGVIGKFTKPDIEPGSFLDQERPYGSDELGQVGAQAVLEVDKRNRKTAATKGVFLTATGTFYPKAWDVEENFGEAHGEMSAFLKFGPTLALRVGGKQLWGEYPYYEAAFIGGPATVRGLRRQRYAGDASVFGNAELRLRLFDFKVLVPIDLGGVRPRRRRPRVPRRGGLQSLAPRPRRRSVVHLPAAGVHVQHRRRPGQRRRQGAGLLPGRVRLLDPRGVERALDHSAAFHRLTGLDTGPYCR